MKQKWYLLTLLLLLSIAVAGCGDSGDDSSNNNSGSNSSSCSVTGTTVNIGSTTGGTYSATLGSSSTTNASHSNATSTNSLRFNNTNLNFSTLMTLSDNSATASTQLADMGAVSCLESITSWPGGTSTSVSYTKGHGYIVKFYLSYTACDAVTRGTLTGESCETSTSTTYARFIANSYSNGSVSVTYQYPFTPN